MNNKKDQIYQIMQKSNEGIETGHEALTTAIKYLKSIENEQVVQLLDQSSIVLDELKKLHTNNKYLLELLTNENYK